MVETLFTITGVLAGIVAFAVGLGLALDAVLYFLQKYVIKQ